MKREERGEKEREEEIERERKAELEREIERERRGQGGGVKCLRSSSQNLALPLGKLG